MARCFLQVHPEFRALLAQNGLVRLEDFLDVKALIVSGHPGRNVGHVNLGSGRHKLRAFLKREYHVRWQDRLTNAWDGFGFVSRSQREAHILRALPDDVAPRCLACGDDGRGRAFVLVAEQTGSVGLREYLRGMRPPRHSSARDRRLLAGSLGTLLARLHQNGFEHRGLLAKHVLVNLADGSLSLIDWQRTRKQGRPLDWPARLRDLAALQATLAAELVSPRERLVCLRSYLSASGPDRPSTALLLQGLEDLAGRLLKKRHIREVRLRQTPAVQGVLWLDGEALCVTSQFHAELRGYVPRWLREPGSAGDGLTRTIVPLPGGRRGLLVWRRRRAPLRWLWSLLRGRPLVTPEVREAGLLFRRQRLGRQAPRLLAFGQRLLFPGRTESFLLTELTRNEGRKAG